MTCLEHLIENCLVDMENGRDCNRIEEIKKDINLELAGITPEQCYEICHYVYYSFISGRYERIKDNYDEQKEDLAKDLSDVVCDNVDAYHGDGYYDFNYDGMAEELMNCGWHKWYYEILCNKWHS